MKSIIFLEANEVPCRVIDDYVARKPHSALAQFQHHAQTYETICEDEIELEPWVSWPTVHRGVTDKNHGILHLSQALDEANRHFPAIWELLQQAGKRVGVFGSLHSSCLPPHPQQYAFYIPDYFAAEAFAHPKSLLPFQQFNLQMTRRSARNIDPGIPLNNALRFGMTALRHGLTAKTLHLITQQLLGERFNPTSKIRRRSIQAVIAADFFMNLLKRHQPQFATFYTNHVAAAMHRYWAAHFTNDWEEGNPMPAEWITTYQGEVTHAMDILDLLVARLMKFVKRHPHYQLLLVSSLGQVKIDTHETHGFTTMMDVGKLMDFLAIKRSDWKQNHAMVPCVSIDINPTIIPEVIAKLTQLEVMGVRAKQEPRMIAPLSFDIRAGKSLHLYFLFENQQPSGEVKLGQRSVSPEAAGFGFFVHEDKVACSAYHTREGYLAVYNPNTTATAPRKTISTLDIAPAILNHFEVVKPSYMKTPSELMLS